MAEQWLSIVEYARTYRVSDMTVRRRIRNGKLHAVLKDGKYFIPVAVQEGRHGDNDAPRGAGAHRPASSAGWRDHTRLVDDGPAPSGQTSLSAMRRPEMTVTRSTARPVPRFIDTPAQPTPSETRHAHAPDRAEDMRLDDGYDEGPADAGEVLPTMLRRPLTGAETALVDTRALLAYCEATMRRLGDSERKVVERFKAKLEALEAVVARKDHEINHLKQQIEDLQLLVRMMERRK